MESLRHQSRTNCVEKSQIYFILKLDMLSSIIKASNQMRKSQSKRSFFSSVQQKQTHNHHKQINLSISRPIYSFAILEDLDSAIFADFEYLNSIQKNNQLLMSIFVKIRNIFIILKIFYWISLKATIKAIRQGSLSRAHENWAAETSKYFKIKLLKCRNSHPLYQEGKCLILSNHRSQADFFIHNVITNYQCNILSRLAVGVVFFIFGLSSSDTVWFFNRSGNINPDKFNEWMDEKFKKSKRPMLLAYPEGHRMAGTTSVSQDHIKTGMIRYSYRRQMPCQLMMTFGNEQVFNEKKISMNWGQSVYYSLSKVYNPQDFKDENQFVKTIKQQFSQYFDQIYQVYTEKGQAELTHDFDHLE